MMETYDLFFRFGSALLIGILIGLQREYAYEEPDEEIFAGIRTFSLLALLGCTGALLADIIAAPIVLVAVVLLVGLFIALAYFVLAWRHSHHGLTTEVAALLTVFIGALCYLDYLALAAAVGVTTTVLLAVKVEMQTLVRRITREDLYATLRFAVITAIILPVLPDQPIGPPPFDVLNLYNIWQIVVLISGISFFGYVLIKILGASHGIALSGILGGLVSSTAVTLSLSERSREEHGLAKPFALAIIVSWTMMFSRVLIEVFVVNQPLFWLLWLPMAAAGLVGLLYCVYLYFSQRASETSEIEFSNPFELGPAIKFGLLYAAILLISRSAQLYMGNAGIFLSSMVAGLADVDAITLTMAELSGPSGNLDLETAERAIVLAVMSNTLVKGGIVLAVGARMLRRTIIPAYVLILITAIGVGFLF